MMLKQMHEVYFPVLYAIMKLSPADAAEQSYGRFYKTMKARTRFIVLDKERIVGCVSFSDHEETLGQLFFTLQNA